MGGGGGCIEGRYGYMRRLGEGGGPDLDVEDGTRQFTPSRPAGACHTAPSPDQPYDQPTLCW